MNLFTQLRIQPRLFITNAKVAFNLEYALENSGLCS